MTDITYVGTTSTAQAILPDFAAAMPQTAAAKVQITTEGGAGLLDRPTGWIWICCRRSTAWHSRKSRNGGAVWLGDLDSNQGFPSQSRKFYR